MYRGTDQKKQDQVGGASRKIVSGNGQKKQEDSDFIGGSIPLEFFNEVCNFGEVPETSTNFQDGIQFKQEDVKEREMGNEGGASGLYRVEVVTSMMDLVLEEMKERQERAVEYSLKGKRVI